MAIKDLAIDSLQAGFLRVPSRRSGRRLSRRVQARLRQLAARQRLRQFNEDSRLLVEFRIGPIELQSIANRLPGPGNRGDLNKARLSAIAGLRMLKPLLAATPGSIAILTDTSDPPRVPARHRIVLEVGENGNHRWFAVSNSANGWQTKRAANDYREGRFAAMLRPLNDADETEFARLVGLDTSKLILDKPQPVEPQQPAQLSRRLMRPTRQLGNAPRRRSDAEVRASLKARGINPDLMPTTR